MPQIIVIADTPADDGADHVVFRERVTQRHLESDHFATQLMERLGWAVEDAQVADNRASQGPRPLHDRSLHEVSAETSQRRSARVVTTAS